MMVGMRGLLSPSSMSKCFEMRSHRLNQSPQQETSVPLPGTFIYHVTIIFKHMFQKKDKMLFLKMCFIRSKYFL